VNAAQDTIAKNAKPMTNLIKHIGITITSSVLMISCSTYIDDGEVAKLPSSFNGVENLIDSIELIALEQPDGQYLGGMVELACSNDNWFVVDKPNCHIHRYSKNGKFLNTIGHKGNSSKEFLTIQNVQILDTLCMVHSIPDKINYYTLDGRFHKGEIQQHLLGDCSVLSHDGILSYMGYKPELKHRLRFESQDGNISKFLKTENYVLNLMTGEPVFYNHGDYISIIDSYSDIVYSFNGQDVLPLAYFDFGSYRIPAEFYRYSDVYQGASFLLNSKFARICRFMGNSDTFFAEVALQDGADAKFVYAIKRDAGWKWYDTGNGYELLSGTFRLFDGENFVAIIEPCKLCNLPDSVRNKIINADILNSINENDNYVVAKIRLR